MIYNRRYYYLVAGFTDLVFDSGRGYPGLIEFREELKNNLHPSDYHLVSLLFLPYDNDNLIAFLEKRADRWNPLGNYTMSDFEEEQKTMQSAFMKGGVIPGYMTTLMAQSAGEEQSVDRVATWKTLTEGYLDLTLGSGSRFLNKWICFDRDLRNILAFLNARELNLNAARYITGNDKFAQDLISIFNSGKDFVIPQDPEYASAIFRIATDSRFLEKERKLDLERWNFIDSSTVFEYFTIDQILGYLIRYSIVLRWQKLEPETGKMMLQKLIDQMEVHAVSARYK